MSLVVMFVVVVVVVLGEVKVAEVNSSDCGSNALLITCLAGCPCLLFSSPWCL